MATTKVNSEFIAVNAISGTIIADGAITSTHLAANCVDSSELVTGSIDTIHIAANQVTSTKIVSDAVLTRHIADDQVTQALIAVNSVGVSELNLSDGTNGQVLTTNGSGTLSFSTVNGTTINNNADNRIITGSGTANTLEGEANFTFDGTTTVINNTGNADSTLLQLKNTPSTAGTYKTGLEFWSNEGTANNQTFNAGRIYSEFDGSNYANTRLTLGSASGGGSFNDEVNISNGNVGIGTSSPGQGSSALTTLTVDGAIMTTNTDTSSIVYAYEQRFNGSNNLTLGYTTNGTTHTGAQVAAQNSLPLVFATAGAERMKLDATGNLTQKHATDGSSRDRYTASALPKISTVGLIGYWDPSKANAYSGSTMNDFSPSGNNDLTMGTGITFTSTADQSYWDFDGTGNASANANIGLAAYRAASFSYWINWDNVNSLNSGYQLNGVQTNNHYMYVGVQQGTNNAAQLYGYIGQGIQLPTNTATGNAYVNSNEWVYLTIQIGHGNSTLTNRTQGRAEVYLNGALVTRRNLTNLATAAASNFYLGRVDGGYYLNGKMGPAVVYHRTLHQWEILENMKVHAPMYLT